ncbi:MAG: hypothetical protein ACRCTR_03440 [Actinomycetota bacterium]
MSDVIFQWVLQPNPDTVTPGVLGFAVMFVLALTTWLLMRDLTRRLRRMRLRAEQEAEEAEAKGEPPPG